MKLFCQKKNIKRDTFQHEHAAGYDIHVARGSHVCFL